MATTASASRSGRIVPILPSPGDNHPDRFFFVQFGPEADKIVPIGMIMQAVSDSRTLGALIRTERKNQGLTQEQLAALSGVGIRFVRELELGKESCRIGLTLTVMTTLGLSLNVSSRGAPP